MRNGTTDAMRYHHHARCVDLTCNPACLASDEAKSTERSTHSYIYLYCQRTCHARPVTPGSPEWQQHDRQLLLELQLFT
jgi:hypothetical protein